jgi:hypothetical protein
VLFPFIPSETMVITAAVLAAAGRLEILISCRSRRSAPWWATTSAICSGGAPAARSYVACSGETTEDDGCAGPSAPSDGVGRRS